MRPGGGKPKGGGYERTVGERISLWLSNGEHRHLLCRTVGSGAQFTNLARKKILAGNAGDLMAQDPLAFAFCDRYIVECKFWKDLELIKFLRYKGELFDALLKVMRESEEVGKEWWLVVKQNNRRDIVFMSSLTGARYFRELDWHSLFNETVIMFDFETFLLTISPERVTACPACEEAAKHAYSDATTPGFFYNKCEKHRTAGTAQ